MKFLIVGESEAFGEYMTDLLIRNSAECLFLSDARKVHSACDEYRPDWLLIDIEMKQQNGFKLAKSMKDRYPDLSLGILSDYQDERFRLKAAEIGADAYLVKENLFDFYQILVCQVSPRETESPFENNGQIHIAH